MLSSRNLFKFDDVIEEKSIKEIKTSFIPREKKTLMYGKNQTLSASETIYIEGDLKKIKKDQELMLENELLVIKQNFNKTIKDEKKKFFQELIELKAVFIAQSEEESQRLNQEAYQIGLEEGKKAGFESGFSEGYQTGLKESEELKSNALNLIKQANISVETYKKEQRQNFVELAAIMAENIIHQELSLDKDSLNKLLKPVLNKIEKNDNFITVFVTTENLETTNDYMNELKKNVPNLSYSVLVDNSLEKNGCVIETNYEIIDLQITKQLDLMMADILQGEQDV